MFHVLQVCVDNDSVNLVKKCARHSKGSCARLRLYFVEVVFLKTVSRGSMNFLLSWPIVISPASPVVSGYCFRFLFGLHLGAIVF